jgi:hypothetical protein
VIYIGDHGVLRGGTADQKRPLIFPSLSVHCGRRLIMMDNPSSGTSAPGLGEHDVIWTVTIHDFNIEYFDDVLMLDVRSQDGCGACGRLMDSDPTNF